MMKIARASIASDATNQLAIRIVLRSQPSLELYLVLPQWRAHLLSDILCRFGYWLFNTDVTHQR